MSIYETVNGLITQSKKTTPEQLALLIARAGSAPFAGDLLEADEALWGSFWQGDVIAPGYLLPAAELALLRATRFDGTWPEGTSLPDFLADLRQAIRHPQAGVWTLRAAGEPCVVFAAPLNVERSMFNVQRSTLNEATVVWYCATTDQLHAGYRAPLNQLYFAGAVEQRPLVIRGKRKVKSSYSAVTEGYWIDDQDATSEAHLLKDFAVRLDKEILRLRADLDSAAPISEE
ncbi:MAG: hypothetical protein L6R45_32075 [Anaerolineae bacterium]|nr:hypothetical protein [Anaerolineae bacterium]